jgi:hypothetical protein
MAGSLSQRAAREWELGREVVFEADLMQEPLPPPPLADKLPLLRWEGSDRADTPPLPVQPLSSCQIINAGINEDFSSSDLIKLLANQAEQETIMAESEPTKECALTTRS